MSRHITRGILLGSGMALAASGVIGAEQNYPDRPIRWIVPYSPGGSTSWTARFVGEHLTSVWGEQVLVDNRPGANTVIGTEAAVRSKPDGYTLIYIGSALASNVTLVKNLPYDTLKDIAPIATVSGYENVFVVHPSLPVKTVKEFIALARRNPNELTFGSSGLGTGSHLAVELFKAATQTQMVHAPYKSTAQAVPDLLAGRIQFMFDFPTTAVQPIKAGKLRGLAVTTTQRSPVLPDLPTVAEAGVEGFEFGTWCGVFAPAGTPPAIADKLAAAFARVLDTPAPRAKLTEQAIEVTPMASQRFSAFLRADIDRWRDLLRSGQVAKLD